MDTDVCISRETVWNEEYGDGLGVLWERDQSDLLHCPPPLPLKDQEENPLDISIYGFLRIR